MDKLQNHLEIPALKVSQPLGDFFVISISARELLDLTFSEPLRHIDKKGNVKGSQRPKDEVRLRQIATYIESTEMAFPNSIILAANYAENGNIIKEESERWRFVENNGMYKIIIPKKIKLAAIIDGQHRLGAFKYVTKESRFSALQLVCSIYFDLPNSYQAFLFATINSNQKKVDRSLALEQFGYNVDDESEKAWTPEKFAVFLSRKLNIEQEISPLYQHIKVTPLGADTLFMEGLSKDWVVSTATIVDGICALISSNPTRDRILMQQKKTFLTGRSREMIKDIKDKSPLRQLFLLYNDQAIYDIIINYFEGVKTVFWSVAKEKSYITKTVGVQACFDVLKQILLKNGSTNNTSTYFQSILETASLINFADKFFQASGIGRSRIKNSILLSLNYLPFSKIKVRDIPFYENILSGEGTDKQVEKTLWEEDAEDAVMNALEQAEWNFEDANVGLYINGDYGKTVKFTSYQDFFYKLVEIAEMAFVSSLPSENELAEQEKEKFDADDLVTSYLSQYSINLKQLGWL